MNWSLWTSCVDEPLGKISKESFSEQTLMELLVSNIAAKIDVHDENGLYRDISTWNGLEFHDNSMVREIQWYYYPLEGNVRLDYLPTELRFCDFVACGLGGSVDTELLPQRLITLNLFDNRFDGLVELENLPQLLEKLFLNRNRFQGSVDLVSLPTPMQYVYLDQNCFSGSVNLSRLPDGLKEISIYQNQLSGSLHLESLPGNLKKLWANNNSFSGCLVVGNLPMHDIILNIINNRINEIHYRSAVPESAKVLLSGNPLENVV